MKAGDANGAPTGSDYIRHPSQGKVSERAVVLRIACGSIPPVPVAPASPARTLPRPPRRPRRWPLGAVLAAAGVVLSACGGGGSSGATAPHFVDDTSLSGISHEYGGGFDYFVGGGVAAFDCDGDGRDELYLAGGSGPAALFHNDSAVGGALRFSQVTSAVTDLTEVTGAYPLDIDSDGQIDLVVLRHGGDEVLRGLGGCHFEDATAQLGLAPATRLDDGVQRDLGGRLTRCRPSRSADTSSPVRMSATRAGSCDPTPPMRATRTPASARAWLLHAVHALQRLEPHRSSRPARVERSPLLPQR